MAKTTNKGEAMIHKLNIDSEQKCKTCGKSGTLEDGFCMAHSPKAKATMGAYVESILAAYAGGFIHIGPKIAAQIIMDVQGLLVENLHKIDVAYTEAEDGITFSLPVKLSCPPAGEGVKVDTSISGILSKMKETRTSVINEKQKDLFKG